MACRTRTACLLFFVLCASFLGGVLSKPRAYAPSAPWKRLPQSQSKAVGNAILGRSGLRFSASAGGVQYALNTVLPVVIKQFAVGQRIPDISGSEDHIDYTISGITIRQLSFSNIAAPVLFNGFQVSVTGISVQVAGSWSASCCCVFGHCLGTDGDFTATTGNAQMSLAGDVLSTADGHPELVLSSVSMDLGSLDIDISGSMFSGLYNLIVGLIKGSIESAAEGAIANAVQSQALSLINQQLAQFPTTFKIPDSPFPLQIDFRLLANASWPFKTGEVPYVAVGMYGSFENPASPQPVVLPTMRPHVLPEGAPLNNYMAQVDVDEYMVNTAFFLQFKEMPVDQSVYNGDLPIFPLTTATFANVLPEFAKLYPSYTILWRFTENDTPQFFANANSSFASATFNWTWAVSNDPNPDVHKKVYTNAFTLNASVSLTTALSFDNHDPRNPAVAFKATPASVFVDLVWSVDALGPFSTTALNAFIQAVVPSLPLSLSRSFPLPTIQCAFLTDPTIVNNDGYVSVLANLKYTGPPPSTGQCPTP